MTQQTTPDIFRANFDQLNGAFMAAKTEYREEFNRISIESWQKLTTLQFTTKSVACIFPRSFKASDHTRLPRDWEPGTEVTAVDGREFVLLDGTPYLLIGSIKINNQSLFEIPIIVPEIDDQIEVLWSTLYSRPKLSVIEKNK